VNAVAVAGGPDLRQRLGRDLAIAAAAFMLLLLWDVSGLDLAAARIFGAGKGFPARDMRWLSLIGHEGARWLGWALVLAMLVNALQPWTTKLTARQRWAWLALTLAAAAMPPLIKQSSLTSCPWDLAEFGGAAHYVSHWRFGVRDGGAGHCFPSGHASTAFALLSGWFVLRDAYPRAARRLLAAVLLAGLLLGAAQLARGAHYPSHTLWTGWLCWVLNAVAAPWVNRGAAGAAGRPP
jgi:membrane-associated PAP2 superfamily phosphatase